MANVRTGEGPRLSVLQGVLPIDPSQIPAEIIAGLTLAALAIPEVMGYTKIAGTPVITGLYTMLIPMALYALFGSSRHLVVGADSATAAILAAGLTGLASTGSDEYVALAGVLAMMAAGFLVIARVIGLGFMADFLSRTVLVGFMTGVGIQVALGQVGGMLGLHGGGHGAVPQIRHVAANFRQLDVDELGVAMAVLVVVVSCRLISKRIPGALIGIVGAIVASWALDLGSRVQVLGTIPGGLPAIGLPEVAWSLDLVERLIPTAFAMFVVILAQSAATSRSYAARYNDRFSENTDLVGLSLANIGAGLSGTFVVNGSPTKTQMVDSAGGRSQLSLLVTALIVLLVLLFFTGPLAYIPEAALAAIVFLIGVELVDLKNLRRIYDQRRSEFWVASITTVMVVGAGVEQGILLAIVLSLIDHTRRGYRPKNLLVIPSDVAGGWRARPLETGAQAAPGLMIYRFTHSMYYANAEQFAEEITTLVKQADPPLRWLCLDAASIGDVDFSAAERLRSIFELLKGQNVKFVLTQILDDVRAESRYHLDDAFGEESYFETLGDVLRAYEAQSP